MNISRIYISNFRNYTDQIFEFSPLGALLIGPNGSGKTNLLEAIAYNSIGRSFRYQSDELLTSFQAKGFALNLEFKMRWGDYQIVANFQNGKKRLSINQQPIHHLSQLFEYLKVIYCAPEDINLINGNPRKRRQYFDLAIAQLTPAYIQLLKNYNHIVEQRNTLLKEHNNSKQKKHWDELFVKAALPVIAARIDYLHKLLTKIHSLYDSTLPEAARIEINYKATLNVEDNIAGSKSYKNELDRVAAREWQYQRTLLGPHLDDYDFMLNPNLLKNTGSQGQKRTIILLVKIAHLELLKESIGEYPILLLDDIFAELDSLHTQRFMQILKNHEQVFVASPNLHTSDYWPELPIIQIGLD